MNRTKKAPDLVLFFAVICLLTIGIIMVYSASSITSYIENDGNSYYYLLKQLQWVAVGFVVMFITMNVGYWNYKKFIIPGVIIAFILLIIVVIPGIGIEVAGSRRWIGFGVFRLQPSELAKLAAVFYTAYFLSNRHAYVKEFWRGIVPPLFLAGVFGALIMLEPDLGTTGALCATVFMMIFAAGAKMLHLSGIGIVGFIALIVLIFSEDYRRDRFLAFLDPWKDPLGNGYHIIQALLAIGSGGLVGAGLGRSRQKFFYLPEQHTDFIFAVIGEELGFIGATTVILLYALLIWRGFQIAMKAPDNFGSLLAVGLTSMIGLQAALNIGVVSGILPVTGITLPLISYGGSSLVITMAGIGVLLNISRYTNR